MHVALLEDKNNRIVSAEQGYRCSSAVVLYTSLLVY